MKPIFTLLGTLFLSLAIKAQNTFPKSGAAGVGTTSPDASSLFEIRSTTKGFLCPRMTMSQRDAIRPVTIGLLIYQTDNTPGFYYYSEAGWKPVSTITGANTALSNLSATTAINSSLLPGAGNLQDLGHTDLPWRNLFVAGIGYLGTAKLGNYTGPAQAGMIRWTGTDFEGYNGTTWVSLTAVGNTYTAGSGIGISGTAITNTAPDQTVTLTSGNGISVTGTYPNFTIASTNNAPVYTAGSGISITGTTITNASPTQWSSSANNIFYNDGLVGIGTATPQNKIDVKGGIAIGSNYGGNFTAPASGAIIEGNLGLGTPIPQNKLDIKGGMAIGNNFGGNFTAPISGAIIEGQLGVGAAIPVNKMDVKGAIAIGSNYGGNFTAPASGAIVEGQVGIGTASPQNKLDVKGGIAIGTNYAGNMVAPTDGALIQGRVGIGTTSPTQQLEVNGTTKTAGLQITNGAVNGYFLQSDASGNASWVNPASLGNSSWTVNGLNQYSAVSGNVGIGTSTPTNKLDVNGSAAIGTTFAANAMAAPASSLVVEGQIGLGTLTPANKLDVRGGMAIGSAYAGNSVSPADGAIIQGPVGIGTSTPVNSLDVKGGLAIGTNYAGNKVSPVDGLIIQGKVGIGTSTPNNNLEVNGSTKTTTLQIINGAASGYILQSDANGNANWVSPSALGSSSNGWTVNGSSQYSTVSGGVGIGISTPTNKLDVNGGVAIGSTFAGNAIVSPANGLVVEGQIGVGTIAPKNKLDVNGGLAIGSNYAGVISAPVSGVVIEGQVGIGTNAPTNKLDVKGGMAVGSTFSGNATPVPTDGLAVEGKVGIGTLSPVNKLDVKGGMAIGQSYAGVTTAPSGSLLVEGQVGLGTATPMNKLDIRGGLAIGSDYAGTKVAPADGVVIEGKVGVGTDAPKNKFDVKGGIAIGSDFAGVVTAPTDGAVIEGKLGVGTSTPTNLLDVKGGAAIGSTFAANATAAPTSGLVVEGQIGVGTLVPKNRLDISGGVVIGSNYSGTKVSPADGLIIQGNVGIGTDAPGNKLEVNGTTKTSGLQITNGAASGYILQSDANGNASWVSPSALGSSGSNGWTVNGSSQYSTVSGGVGIGTSTPVNKLDIKGGTAIGSDYAGVKMAPVDGVVVEGKVGIGTDMPTNKLDVKGGVAIGNTYAGNATAAPANSMILEGQMGVGTATPRNKLDVSGGVAIGSDYAGNTVTPQNGMVVEGNVGIGTNTPTHLLELGRDDAFKPGSGTWSVASDRRLKKNINAFTDGWNVLKDINPVWFTYNGEAGITNDLTAVGTVAQDLQKAAPYMVRNWKYADKATGKTTEYLAANYHALFFLLTNEAKAQHRKVDSLTAVNTVLNDAVTTMQKENAQQQQSIDQLKTQLNLVLQKLSELQSAQEACCAKENNVPNTKSTNIQLEGDVPVLEQNTPNPFGQNTVIRYYLPSGVSSASIIFSDVSGITLKTMILNKWGKGEINLASGSLSAGTYFYSLIINGKVFDTKKMLIVRQ